MTLNRALEPVATMRAVVLRGPGPAENVEIRQLPIPQTPPGWVRVEVEAFGINRADVHLRLGLAECVRFPIVPGIEAVGIVDDPNGTDLQQGQQVAAVLGGMGRGFDGGYAEYTVVPRRALIPFRSELPWAVLGHLGCGRAVAATLRLPSRGGIGGPP